MCNFAIIYRFVGYSVKVTSEHSVHMITDSLDITFTNYEQTSGANNVHRPYNVCIGQKILSQV